MSEQLEILDVFSAPQTRRGLLLGPLARLGGTLAGLAISACGEADERPPASPGTTSDQTLSNAGASEGAPPPAAPASPGGGEIRARDQKPPAALDSDAGVAPGQTRETPTAAHPCARPTSFPAFVDNGPRASFRRDDESTTLDWATIALSMSFVNSKLSERIMRLLGELDQLYIGHPFSMLECSLYAAARAKRDTAADDWVVAALCHRLGMTLSVANYAELSASIMRGYVSDEAYRVVLHLADFTQTPDVGESDRLAARARHQAESWFAAAVRFADVWLSPVRATGERPATLAELEPQVRSVFSRVSTEPYKTNSDCF